MCEKIMKPWHLDVPWGKLAMVSWGDPGQPPVLLMHGYSDTAATFVPLVNLLPDTYHYVGFDLPGHGWSEPVPGPPVSYLHFVDCIRVIVEQQKWSTFICIAHSLGYLISCCYNAAFPGRMAKLVNLDGSLSIGWHYLTDNQGLWFQHGYSSYYDNYYPPPEPANYTYDEAISLLVRTRSVSAQQAAILASRCLKQTDDGTFRFTWDPKIKKMSMPLFSFDVLHYILASKTPILNIVASEYNRSMEIEMFTEYTKKMVNKLAKGVNYYILNVEGGHDVHLTNPGSFVENIVEFLERDFTVSKL